MGRIFEVRKATMFARWDRMAKQFTRIGREIAIAVKAGGPRPGNNPALRRCMQNAKSVNMPKDRVEAAIKRAMGKEMENYEEILYEGYGPHGVALLVETATAIRNLPFVRLKAQLRIAAATVHLGGTFEELAASEYAATHGQITERPFVLVAQQSLFDDTRAPSGQHTGWAYCHVPHGSTANMTERIERQLERFAPGFTDLILARRTMSSTDIEVHNANMIGGDIGGGANNLAQFVFRPTRRWDPYSTPNARLFLCSSSTPPGGGVHGMCGHWAAMSALGSVLG